MKTIELIAKNTLLHRREICFFVFWPFFFIGSQLFFLFFFPGWVVFFSGLGRFFSGLGQQNFPAAGVLKKKK